MKNTKTKSIVALAIVLVLTVVFGIVGVTGMSFQGGLWKLLPWLPTTNADAWPQAISLGLDLRGGVYVEYSAEAPEGNDANFSDLLDATVSAIQSRLTDKGYAESTVQVLGTSGIRVEIPDVSDPSEILNLIGEPALLEFKDPDGNTFMTGSDVRLAQAAMTQDGQWAISFQLTSAGTKLFADMTSQNIGKTLGIYLDGEKLMAPTVQSAITGGSGQVTGNFTMDRAQTIAAQIQSGALGDEAHEVGGDTAVVPGLDGQKMSKSYGNTLPLFADPAEAKKLIMKKLEMDEREWCATCQEGFRAPSYETIEVETDGQNGQHPAVLNAFAAHILRGEPLVADGREGINGLMLSNAIHLSSWLGHPVTLPIDEKLFLEKLNERRATSRAKTGESVFSDTNGTYGSK